MKSIVYTKVYTKLRRALDLYPNQTNFSYTCLKLVQDLGETHKEEKLIEFFPDLQKLMDLPPSQFQKISPYNKRLLTAYLRGLVPRTFKKYRQDQLESQPRFVMPRNLQQFFNTIHKMKFLKCLKSWLLHHFNKDWVLPEEDLRNIYSFLDLLLLDEVLLEEIIGMNFLELLIVVPDYPHEPRTLPFPWRLQTSIIVQSLRSLRSPIISNILPGLEIHLGSIFKDHEMGTKELKLFLDCLEINCVPISVLELSGELCTEQQVVYLPLTLSILFYSSFFSGFRQRPFRLQCSSSSTLLERQPKSPVASNQQKPNHNSWNSLDLGLL
jgi:hypothetical protein